MARILKAAKLFGFLATCAVALFAVNKVTLTSLYYLRHRSRAVISTNHAHNSPDFQSHTRKMSNDHDPLSTRMESKKVITNMRGTNLDLDLDSSTFTLPQQSAEGEVASSSKSNVRKETEAADAVSTLQNGHKQNLESSVKITDSSPKFLIYICDRAVQKCGGLADRLKGIIYGYILANITRRRFRIHMPLPGCEFSSFLGVNRFDWRINMSRIKEQNLSTTVYNRLNEFYFARELETLNYTEFFRNVDVVLYTSNLERLRSLMSNPYHASDLDWIQGRSHRDIYREILQRLFVLTPPLQRQVDEIIDKVKSRANLAYKSGQSLRSNQSSRSGQRSRSEQTARSALDSNLQHREGKLVCAQIRMGQNPTIPNDSQQRVKDGHLKIIWKFLKTFLPNTSVSFFVSTDSEDVLDKARKVFGTRLLEVRGSIVHVDRPRERDDVCVGMRRAIVDMHVLTRCDVLLLTRSGLGKLALFLRKKRTGLFVLKLRSSLILNISPDDFR